MASQSLHHLQQAKLSTYKPPNPSVKRDAALQKVPEGYIGFVEELPGANTQGATLDETRENLAEAVTLVLEANRALAEESIEGQDVIREKMPLPAA
jgi:predicted RNase H-like HicB family nuclease